MIRSILFLAVTFVSAGLSAQTFQFNDENDVDIANTSYRLEDNAIKLSQTKFHVKNLSGATASYTADVQLISTTTSSDLQVCYGTLCLSASSGILTLQEIGDSSIVAAGVTDDSFKVGPFTGSWVSGDSAVWRVVVRNVADPADTASSTITWVADATTAVEELVSNNIKLTAFPNPAVDNLTVQYDLNGIATNAELNVFDVLGQKIISKNLNGNQGSVKLDLETINSGVYFYAIRVAGENIRTERFIVQ